MLDLIGFVCKSFLIEEARMGFFSDVFPVVREPTAILCKSLPTNGASMIFRQCVSVCV